MSEQQPPVAGRYQIAELIGRGGMGDVYRGLDTQTGGQVALKLLHESIVLENPDIVDRFTREGEALSKLDHPNIVKLLGTVQENNKHYLIMEYVSGGSLRDLIDEQARLPLEAVLNIALDLSDALTRAHRLNIIHRDIKPDNVLLADDGTPRLTDFGVAHLGDRTRLTQTGSVIGTYAYLSPEACNGLDLDERADIWSFGVMLFEMLAGRVPFQEIGTAAILTAILTKPAPDITRLRPGIPEPLADLIARMLEKDRERRVSSVRVVGAELEAIIRALDTPIRDLVLLAGEKPSVGSRFITPSDDVPAMQRSSPQQTHGLSLYPAPPAAISPPPYTPGMMMTPGGTPLSTMEMAMAPAAVKWKWIALMVIVTVLACSVVATLAILLDPDSSRDENTLPNQPPAGIDGQLRPPLGLPANQPSTPAPVVVEPVGEGEFMVLVAQLEPLAGAEQTGQPARFITNDLEQTLEETVPYSTIRVRTYPDVVTSDEQANAVAEEFGATVIVWGNYSADLIELEMQMGTTTAFPYLQFQRDLLERTVNVRLHMTDPQRESIAPYALNMLNILQNADGNAFDGLRTGAIQDAITVTPAEIVGNTVAANMHRASLSDNRAEALDYLKSALELDAGNALLYIYSSIIKQQDGQTEDALRDAQTAQRIGPPDWSLPLLITAAMSEDASVLDLFNQVIEQRPDDWFPYFFRGSIYYELANEIPNGYALAKADLDQSIALKPTASFPYVYRAMLALHEGRLADAGQMINLVLTEFPDPDYMKRLLLATFGDETLNPYSLTLSAFTNLTLGQYASVVDAAQVGIEKYPQHADSYWMQGIAHCGLGDFAAAEASFSGGLEQYPALTLFYLLRADARLQQGNKSGADEDFAAIKENTTSAEYAAAIQAVKDRTLTCANFLSPDNPIFGAAAGSAPVATPDAEALAAVEPVAAGELMVLVAAVEPLEGVTERDVARFVTEDLRRIFEEEIPFSQIRVRQYPAIITSSSAARAVATAASADVIIWGSYTAEQVELEVQIGVTDEFPYIPFPREMLERSANVRVYLTSERRESVALNVLNTLNILANADGNEFQTITAFMLTGSVTATSAEIVGNSTAAHLHRALSAYGTDADLAIEEFGAAIAADSANPLPYVYRALAYLRTNNVPAYQADAETMQRLAPEAWAMPYFWTVEESILTAAQGYQALIDLRPDDWFVYFLRGVFYYYTLKDFDKARADFEQSIALKPAGNLPYLSALVIALREGRMADAQALNHTILTEYPDPELTNRALRAVYGDSVEHDFIGTFFAASTNYALGQYDDVTEQIKTFTDYLFDQPGADMLPGQNLLELGDIFLLQGLAYCNLKDYAAAEDAYDKAIAYSKDFKLIYVLRGQVRVQQGESSAEEDFAAARDHDLGPEFTAWVESGALSRWSCETIGEYQPPQ